MRTDLIKSKVIVFVSSKCGGRYTIVRKAIDELLLNSGLANTYVFESAPGSSVPMPDAYLAHIDESHLCVFLIDNEDGVSEAVYKEYKRAIDLDKKIICIFCDENQKEPTELQKDIIDNGDHKFCIIHEFSDFPFAVYSSTIQDIVDIYKYISKFEHTTKLNSDEVALSLPRTTNIIKKDILQGFNKTKNELVRLFIDYTDEIESTSTIDELVNEFLGVFICRNNYNADSFKKLYNEIVKIQQDELKEVISLRLSAIELYLNDNLDKCVEKLEYALESSSSNPLVPNWLSNDIAIDLRNMLMLQHHPLNTYLIKNKGQLYINDNEESVYFPVLDRIKHKISEDTIQRYYKLYSDSPYTTNLGGHSIAFEAIAEYFCVSMVYGSITHCICIRDYLIDALRPLCQEYSNREFFIELIKLLLIQRKDSDLQKLVRTLSQKINTINFNDIENILCVINRIPVLHQKRISEYLTLKYLGNHFSDEQYSSYSNKLVKFCFEWLDDEKSMIDLDKYIFDFLKFNVYRLDINEITEFVFKVISSKSTRFYRNAFELSTYIDYSEVIEETQTNILSRTIEVISDEELKNISNNITRHITRFRVSATINMDKLDECIKDKMTHFYEKIYQLESLTLNRDEYWNHIENYISSIDTRNKVQGKGGNYIGLRSNPYGTILNIIKNNSINLNWTEVNSITDICLDTLHTPTQEYGDKCSAINLISFLFNNYDYKENIINEFSNAFTNADGDILTGYEIVPLSADTKDITVFSLHLLLYTFGIIDSAKMIKSIVKIASLSNYEIIRCLSNLNIMLDGTKFDKFDDSVLQILVSLLAMMLNHVEQDVRYNAIRCLILLTHSNMHTIILPYLSTVIDEGAQTDKIAILARIESISSPSEKLVKYIIQKGKADNNYLVRERAIEAENIRIKS